MVTAELPFAWILTTQLFIHNYLSPHANIEPVGMHEVEAWLSGLPDCSSFNTSATAIRSSPMPRTPSPTKRRRLDGAGDNNNDDKEARNDVTPRAISLSTKPSSFSSNANNEPFSAREHVSVSRTSSPSIRSSQSSRSSPTKQDLAMRFARDLPIHYRSIPSAPQRVQALAEQLADLESKQGILPGRLRATLQAYHSPGEPIKNYMFDDRHNSNSAGGKELDTDVQTLDRELEHLKEIRDNTQECNSRGRVFHEVEWNETVHSPMLRLATKRFKELTCRNLYVRPSSSGNLLYNWRLLVF